MYKALIVGCGNIGALYDFNSGSIATYAKSFHLDTEIEFEVYDKDPKVARKIADRYGVRSLEALYPANYKNYDFIAICTPTSTHYEYLSVMLEQGPKVIICEKPVDVDCARLEGLKELYGKSKCKVMVNYFRRFQPGLIALKRKIEEILEQEPCRDIVVTYQRGFHNNASHAIDLLEFILGSEIDFSEARISNKVYDEFDDDPTLSVSCVWNGINVQIIGLAHVKFTHFDVSLYFSRKAVLLKGCSNEIEIFSTVAESGNFHPKLCLHERQTGVIDNHMVNVVSHAKRLLTEKELPDNFMESVSVSERILKLLGR